MRLLTSDGVVYGSYTDGIGISTSIGSSAVSPNGKWAIYGDASTPFVKTAKLAGHAPALNPAYNITPSSAPSTPINGSMYVGSFSPSGRAVIVGSATAPYVNAYAWDDGTGIGTKYVSPTTDATAALNGLAWHHTGAAFAFITGSGTGRELGAYKWSDDFGFGTKYTSASGQSSGSGWVGSESQLNFSPDGRALVYTYGAAPFFRAIRWDYDSGFGTQYTDVTNTGSNSKGIVFSKSGNTTFNTANATLQAYPWTYASGFGTKYTDASTAVASLTAAICEASNGILYTKLDSPPNWAGWPFVEGTGFGTQLVDNTNNNVYGGGNDATIREYESDAPTLYDVRAVPLDSATGSATATNTANPTAIVPPRGMKAGDLVIMVGQQRATGATTLAVSATGGQTWTTEASLNGTSLVSARIFWCVFNGTWTANPSVSFTATTCNSAYMMVFRPSYRGRGWTRVGAQLQTASTTVNATAALTAFSGQNPGITFAAFMSPDDNQWNSGNSGVFYQTSFAGYRNIAGSDQSAMLLYTVHNGTNSATFTATQTSLGPDNTCAATLSFSEVYKPSLIYNSQLFQPFLMR